MTANAQAVGGRLVAAYRDIQRTAMIGMPICNDALSVEAVGFRECEGYVFGVIVTPWFLNLIVAPTDLSGFASGVSVTRLRFPAGDVEFQISDLQGFGRLASCSLFSPMSDFADQQAARETAQAALDALLDRHLLSPARDKPASRRDGLDRRALFGARRREAEDREAAP